MRDKILTMKAGVELDVLVAEKVMKHKLGWYTDYGFKKEYERRVIALENDRYNHIPCYSTDISAAMEALDKLKDDYDAVNLVYCNGSWQCILTTVTGSDEGDDDFNVTDISYDSPNMAEAICITCLLAVIES